MNSKFLIPHRYKKIGWVLLIPAIVVGLAIVFVDFKFEFLNGKVFTLYANPFMGKQIFFGLNNGNYTNTIVGVLIIVGALLVSFSREKVEDEYIQQIRFESLVWATYVNYAVLLFCFLFFFESEFLMVMIFNMFTILIIFLTRFHYLLYRSKNSLRYEK